MIGKHAQAKQAGEKLGFPVVFDAIVKKIHDKRGHADRSLIITEGTVSFFNGSQNTRTGFWIELSNISLAGNRIEMTIGDSLFRFESEKALEILNVIGAVVQRILTKEEIHKLHLKKFGFDKQTTNITSFINRLKSHYMCNNMKITDSIIQKYIREIETNPQCFSYFPPSDTDFLLKSFSILHTRELEVPKQKGTDQYKLCVDYFKYIQTAECLKFSIEPTEAFGELLDLIENEKHSKITALTFDGVSIPSGFINSLTKLLSVSFINCSGTESPVTSVQYASFNKSPYSVTDNLRSLSLIDMNIEISKFLKTLESYTSLRMLDLDSNRFTGKDVISIPDNISLVSLQNVEWETDSFINLFKAISECSSNIRLSVKQAKNIQWDNAISAIKDINCPHLVSLNWSMNGVTDGLFKFFAKANLSSLYISESIPSSMFQEFSSFISSNETITKLVVKGNQTINAGANISLLLKALKINNTVETLDISNHYIGDDGLHMLKDCLPSISLHCIIFDGQYPNYFESISDVMGLQVETQISFPIIDVLDLYERNVISYQQLSSTKFQVVHIQDEFPPFLDCSIESHQSNPPHTPRETTKEKTLKKEETFEKKKEKEVLEKTQSETEESVVLEDKSGELRKKPAPHIEVEPQDETSMFVSFSEEWEFPIRMIPQGDNKELAKRLDRKYSIANLVIAMQHSV